MRILASKRNKPTALKWFAGEIDNLTMTFNKYVVYVVIWVDWYQSLANIQFARDFFFLKNWYLWVCEVWCSLIEYKVIVVALE